MSSSASLASEPARLAAARAGDRDAFAALMAEHLAALHTHCYRMLGSLHDADDAMQEVQLLAWRGLDGFEGRAPLKHWLYRITTTTCLKMIRARGRIPLPTDELVFLQPYPDRLLDQVTDASADPAAVAEQRESVSLAFITAVQRLPASQRAALLLRDVLAFSPAETAEQLGTTVAAANSLLQRARVTMRTRGDTTKRGRAVPLSDAERQIVDRFVDAWQHRDIPKLAALLSQDAVLRMPPELAVFTGREQIVQFFSTVPANGRLDLIELAVVRANGQPALAAYLPDDRGACRGYGIMVLDVTDNQISSIVGFPDATLFSAFGLADARPRLPG